MGGEGEQDMAGPCPSQVIQSSALGRELPFLPVLSMVPLPGPGCSMLLGMGYRWWL